MNSTSEYVSNYITMIDKISKVFNLPNVRKFILFDPDMKNTDVLVLLSKLGFLEIEYEFMEQFGGTDYLYVSDVGCCIGTQAINADLYDRAIRIFRSIPEGDRLSMTAEELELYIRMI